MSVASCCSGFCGFDVEVDANNGKVSAGTKTKVGEISSTGQASIGTHNGNLASSGAQSVKVGNVANFSRDGATKIGADGFLANRTKNLAVGGLGLNQETTTSVDFNGFRYEGVNTFTIGDKQEEAKGGVECCTDQCCAYEAACGCCDISLSSTDCTDCIGGCCESTTQVAKSAVSGCLDCATGCFDCAGNCTEAVNSVATGCFECLGGAFSCISELASAGLGFVGSFVSDD